MRLGPISTVTSSFNVINTGIREMVILRIAKQIAFGLGALISFNFCYAEAVTLQSTTSTKNSGFYDYILPMIKKDTGITVNVVAVGTGQAIKNAQRCDGDVLLVHAKAAEERFVSDGYGIKRFDLMFNDFVIVGPPGDPANVAGSTDVSGALKSIAFQQTPFASRGDNSGTHKAEKKLWEKSGIDPSHGSGIWYLETGSGMGSTLNISVGKGAYVLSDRATWIKFGNKQDFKIHVQGDKRLFNQYGITQISPEKCPNVKSKAGQKFISWLLSDKGQSAIESYRIDGNQLFFPNAQ
jgi:tungstate transport system substrate-binding protein